MVEHNLMKLSNKMHSLQCIKTKCKTDIFFFPTDIFRQIGIFHTDMRKLVFHLFCRFLRPSRVLFFSNLRANFYQNRYG